MSAEASWSRLGEFLVSRGVVSIDQLEAALAEQRRTERPLGQTLVSLGFVSEAALADALLEQVAAAVAGSEPADRAEERESAPASPAPIRRRRARWLRRERPAPDPELARAVAEFEQRSAEVERAIAEVRAALREFVPVTGPAAASRD